MAYAVASKSARLLSMVTRNPSALNHAIRYRGSVFYDPASTVGAFSEQNLDGILYASIILFDGNADW